VEGNPRKNDGTFKVHVHSVGKQQWYQIQDLIVEEILPQMIFLSESYLQVCAAFFDVLLLTRFSQDLAKAEYV
jgi:hypothetical protein